MPIRSALGLSLLLASCAAERGADQIASTEGIRRIAGDSISIRFDKADLFSVAIEVHRLLDGASPDGAPGSVIYDWGPAFHEAEVTLEARASTVPEAVLLIERQTGLRFRAMAGAFYVSTPERVAAAATVTSPAQETDASVRDLLGRDVSFCLPFGGGTLREMAGFLDSLTKLRIVVLLPDDSDPVLQAQIVIRDMHLGDALWWLAVLSGTDLRFGVDEIAYVPRKSHVARSPQPAGWIGRGDAE